MGHLNISQGTEVGRGGGGVNLKKPIFKSSNAWEVACE